MKVLSGVHPHGSYEGDDHASTASPVEFSNIRDSEHAGIVIIHQELALIPELSIAENIFLGNEDDQARRDRLGRRRNNRARELLARVGLDEDPETPIKNIGVGKQQLVEIAKALSKEVKLLILDEPTAALNEEDSRHLLDLIRGLQGRGITCIMISHKLNEIEAIADAITIIRDGMTVETLDVREGARRRGPDHPRHGRPLAGVPLPRPHARHRRDVLRGQGLDRRPPADPRPAGGQGVRTSSSAAARSSGSPD